MLKKLLASALVVLACAGSVELGRRYFPKNAPAIDDKYRERSRGNPGAPLWVIEYMDFQCESCREALPLMDGYLKKHPREMYLQVRYYPLILNHLYALKTAIYAECASRQKKFQEYSHALFESQDEWADAVEPDSILRRLAAEKKLDLKALDGCVEDASVKEAILSEKAEGKSLGVRMTPTFFVNGAKVEGVPAVSVELDGYFEKLKRGGKAS